MWRTLRIVLISSCLVFLTISALYLKEDFSFVFIAAFTVLILYMLYNEFEKKFNIYYYLFWIVFVVLVSQIKLPPPDLIMSVKISLSLEKMPACTILIKYFISNLFVFLIGAIATRIILGYKKILAIENLPIMWGFGTGFLSFILILLGTISNFFFPLINLLQLPILFVTFILFLLLIGKNKDKLKFDGFWKKEKSLPIILILPFFITTLLHVVFYPELYWDSLIYGINLSRIYLEKNKIPLIAGGPSLGIEWSANYPPAHQVLVAFLFSTSMEHSIFSRFFSFLTSIFLIILTYFWSKELFEERSYSLLSLMLLTSIPLFILFSRYTIYYIYLLFQMSLSLFFLYKFYIRNKYKDLYLSSLFAGFSLLSSYMGFVYFLILVTILFLKRIKNLKVWFICVLICGFIYSPWFFRNLFYLHNPFWPFGGGKYIDKIIWKNTLTIQNEMSKILGFNFENLENLKLSIYRFLFTYPDFYSGIIINGLKPIFTLFVIPSILLVLKRRDKKMIFFVIVVLLQVVVYIIIFRWFERYLIVITLPTVFLSVYSIKYFSRSLAGRYLSLILVFILYINSTVFSLNWDECHGMNKEAASQILENLGNYEKILEICYKDSAKAWSFISSNIPKDHFIATNDMRHYYMRHKNLIDIDSWKLRELYYINNAYEGIRTLCEKNITYLYLNRLDISTILPNWIDFIEFTGKVIILKEFNNIKIYKIDCD